MNHGIYIVETIYKQRSCYFLAVWNNGLAYVTSDHAHTLTEFADSRQLGQYVSSMPGVWTPVTLNTIRSSHSYHRMFFEYQAEEEGFSIKRNAAGEYAEAAVHIAWQKYQKHYLECTP